MRIAVILVALAALAACKGREPAVAPLAQEMNEPTLLAGDQPGPSAIALDATDLYWNDWGKPIVRKMPRAGGPVTTLYSGAGEVGGRSIALDDDGVVFDEAFQIRRVPKAGGPATVIGSFASLPARLVADRDGVYIVDASSVRVFPRGAAAPILLAGEPEPWDVAVDATHVYWVARGGVRRTPKKGGPVETLAVGAFRFAKITVTDTDVTWADGVLEAVFSVPKAGGRVRYLAHDWNMAGKDLVVTGGFVWTMQMGGQLDRIDPATGTTTMITTALERGGSADHYLRLAFFGEDVFVASGGEGPFPPSGEILRVSARPPPKAIVSDRRAAQIAMVWFKGTTADVQDPANAVRWIAELDDAIVPDVRAGKLGLRLIAEVPAGLPEATARQRARFVEDAIREKLGAGVRIVTLTAPPRGYHGDVEVTVDTDELTAAMSPPR